MLAEEISIMRSICLIGLTGLIVSFWVVDHKVLTSRLKTMRVKARAEIEYSRESYTNIKIPLLTIVRCWHIQNDQNEDLLKEFCSFQLDLLKCDSPDHFKLLLSRFDTTVALNQAHPDYQAFEEFLNGLAGYFGLQP